MLFRAIGEEARRGLGSQDFVREVFPLTIQGWSARIGLVFLPGMEIAYTKRIVGIRSASNESDTDISVVLRVEPWKEVSG